MSMPGNGEHHAAIAGMRHHDGRVAFEERLLENKMNALARFNHVCSLRIGHMTDAVSKHAGSIDHDTRLDTVLVAAFIIASDYAVDIALFVFEETGHRHAVRNRRAMIDSSRCEMDEQAGIVKLTVEVNDAAAQAFSLQCGQALQSLVIGKNP